jgi:hypothetical protein
VEVPGLLAAAVAQAAQAEMVHQAQAVLVVQVLSVISLEIPFDMQVAVEVLITQHQHPVALVFRVAVEVRAALQVRVLPTSAAVAAAEQVLRALRVAQES